MKFFTNAKTTMVTGLMLVMVVSSVSYANANNLKLSQPPAMKVATVTQDYSFKVHNNTNTKITKILVSEDGNDYGYFDIGGGIAPGATVELVWDKSTNGESCHQYFKAVFSTGEESQAVKFDFCESGLVLEFS